MSQTPRDYLRSFSDLTFGLLGLQLRRKPKPSQCVWSVRQTDLVVDIGANIGQFARSLRKRGYVGKIVSVEPGSAAHSALVRAAKDDPDWVIFRRSAVGETFGQGSLRISQNSVSTSLLAILPTHLQAEPRSEVVSVESCDVVPLTHILDSSPKSKRILVKLDVQGAEAKILESAAETLQRVDAWQIEMSLVHLYENQELFVSLVSKMQRQGFEIWDIEPVFREPHTSRLLQCDVTLVRC